MKVTYAHLCDYASVSREGKLSAMGIFDRIFVHALPSVQPIMYLAFGLELRPAELDRQFDLLIKLVEQDGKSLVEMISQGKVAAAATQPGQPIGAPQIFALAGVPLEREGTFSLDIFLNSDHKASATFAVQLLPPGQDTPLGLAQ